MKVTTNVEHLEKVTAVIDRHTLEQILIDAAAKEARVNLRRKDVTAKVEYREETEGSPPYRVGYSAIVRITIDHANKADVSADEGPLS